MKRDREDIIDELLDILGEDIFTDDPEYAERVGRVGELINSLLYSTDPPPMRRLDQ